MIESEKNAGEGWTIAITIEHLFRLVLVPKALSHSVKINKRRAKDTR